MLNKGMELTAGIFYVHSWRYQTGDRFLPLARYAAGIHGGIFMKKRILFSTLKTNFMHLVE